MTRMEMDAVRSRHRGWHLGRISRWEMPSGRATFWTCRARDSAGGGALPDSRRATLIAGSRLRS